MYVQQFRSRYKTLPEMKQTTDGLWFLWSSKLEKKSRHKNLKLSICRPDSLVNSEDHDEMQLQ